MYNQIHSLCQCWLLYILLSRAKTPVWNWTNCFESNLKKWKIQIARMMIIYHTVHEWNINHKFDVWHLKSLLIVMRIKLPNVNQNWKTLMHWMCKKKSRNGEILDCFANFDRKTKWKQWWSAILYQNSSRLWIEFRIILFRFCNVHTYTNHDEQHNTKPMTYKSTKRWWRNKLWAA